jgi:deoxyribodipyrimidine photo-lyase
MRLFHTTLTLLSRNMSKRARSPTPPFGGVSGLKEKKPKTEEAQKLARKVATPEAAAAVDAAPPYIKLRDAMKAASVEVAKGDAVVYWHRMEDVRSEFCRVSELSFLR